LKQTPTKPNQKTSQSPNGKGLFIMTASTLATNTDLSQLIADVSVLFGSRLKAYTAVKATGKATDASVWKEIYQRYSVSGSATIVSRYTSNITQNDETEIGSWLDSISDEAESFADTYLDAFNDSGKRCIDRDRLNILLRIGR
jgi:hypothetical protein